MEVLITSLIGLVSTFVSGFVSHFFTKRKYNAEVDSKIVNNIKDSIGVYDQVIKDLENKLAFYVKLAETNRVEVHRIKSVIYEIIDRICKDTSCTKRKLYTEEEIKEILNLLDSNDDTNN